MPFPVVKLSSLADLLPGISPQERGEVAAYPCVLPAQIAPGRLVGGFGTMHRANPIREGQALRPDDVLVRRVNPDCAAVFTGMPPTENADVPGAVLPSANVLVIRPGPELLPDYAAFLLSATSVLAKLRQASGVGTQVAALSPARLGEAPIPLPAPAVQRRYGEAWRASLRIETALRAQAEGQARLQTLLGESLFERQHHEP